MEYQEFIDGVNNGTIQKVLFSVKGYAHYRHCIMETKISSTPSGTYVGKIIWFRLTPDGTEKKGFLNDIDENTKMFYIKNKGSFTLKQMWNNIIINSIE